jgi:translation initiation factor RLI1
LARLRAEQAKLEEEVKSSQEKKRKGMYAWEKSKREAEIAGFRVEVAEGQLLANELAVD